MVKLRVPLYIDSRMIPAGEEIALPGQLETLLLEAGNAERISADPLPSMPEPPSVPEPPAVDEAAPGDKDTPEQAEEIPPEPEKPPRRYGR